MLDGQTLAHIEVLQNSQGGIEGTLFQLLSRCVTPFGKALDFYKVEMYLCFALAGKRQFKLWLCSPLRDAVAINARFVSLFHQSEYSADLRTRFRLDAVEDLLANPPFATGFDALAKTLPDLERLLSRVHARSCKKQDL